MAVSPKRPRGKPAPEGKTARLRKAARLVQRGSPAPDSRAAKRKQRTTPARRVARAHAGKAARRKTTTAAPLLLKDVTPDILDKICQLYFWGVYLDDIATLSNTTRSVIETLIKRNRWPRRGKARTGGSLTTVVPFHYPVAGFAAPPAAPSPDAAGSFAKRDPADETDLVQRLTNAIDETLSEIEVPPGAGARGHYDKKTRAIASMVRSLEKVLEIKVKRAKANDKSGGTIAEKVRIDAEQLRRDIAERLERLQRKRDAETPSE